MSPGSSPRVRGTGHFYLLTGLIARFIPACAGNRHSRIQHVYASPVHPRVCGEQNLTRPEQPEQLGSSPRVRGTADNYALQSPKLRFIPACAGNRIQQPEYPVMSTVHPRVCGEQRAIEPLVAARFGSSPRVRGTGRVVDHNEPY